MNYKISIASAICGILFAISAPAQTMPAAVTPAFERAPVSFQVIAASAASGGAQTSAQTYTRPTAKERFRRYAGNVLNPYPLLGNAVSAGIATATNEPEEWGKGWKGFGRRFASNVGTSAIRETAIYGLDEALKFDSGFYRSNRRDARSKFTNAVLSTFTARKPNGRRVVGVPRIAGTYAANVIAAEAWFPKRFSYRDGLRNGTFSLGFNAAFNLLREFVLKK